MASMAWAKSSLRSPSIRREGNLTTLLGAKTIAIDIPCSSIRYCNKCALASSPLSAEFSGPDQQRRRRLGTARAAGEDEEVTGSKEDESFSSSSSGSSSVKEDRRAAAKLEAQQAKTTAIITGTISVLLGVGYLVLINLLDTRGIELIPPPPEAFNLD